ncbi:unnamed protein product [Blepharisma stoltei]|uniref:Ycf1 n=1 Tax=Blepharisma stoltei TaxID=1481888 RepID=A0AAU9JN58_9CILI|nr:unnamed protein product [Blepharisma stoltei]
MDEFQPNLIASTPEKDLLENKLESLPTSPNSPARKKYRLYGKIVSQFFCQCSICNFQIKRAPNKPKKIFDYTDYEVHKQGKLKTFTWLLIELGKLSKKLPIKITVPDTVIFRRGKPIAIVQPLRESYIKMTSNPERLNLAKILKSFTKIVKKRKKEDLSLVKGNNENDSAVFITQDLYGKETVLLKYLVKGKDCAEIEENPQFEDGVLRVMSEKEFTDFMCERPGSLIWRTISYIQTVIKCKFGIGEIITVELYSDRDNRTLSNYIEEQENETQLMYSDPKEYCQLMCKRIVSIIFEHTKYQILKIKAEFMKDDENKIWLAFAPEIYVRNREMPTSSRREAKEIIDTPDQSPGFFITEKSPNRSYSESLIKNPQNVAIWKAKKIILMPLKQEIRDRRSKSSMKAIYCRGESNSPQKIRPNTHIEKIWESLVKSKKTHVRERSLNKTPESIRDWCYTPPLRFSPMKNLRSASYLI